MNKKIFIIGVMAASLSLNSFGQKCTKFIDYQNKTINTNGINLRILGQPIGVGATSIAPVMREASEKLQTLDLLQYTICEQLKTIKTDFLREKAQMKYSNVLIQMMELLKEEGIVASDNPLDSSQPSEKREKSSSDPTPNPTPAPTPTPVPIPPLPEPMFMEVTCPCEEFNRSTSGKITGFGQGSSMDMQIARRAARTSALEELASKIEITVKTVTTDYSLQTTRGINEELEKRIENLTETSVNQTLTRYTTICERNLQDPQTKRFNSYIALEISEENALRPVFDDLQKEAALKNALPNFERFREKFNEVQKMYDNSFYGD